MYFFTLSFHLPSGLSYSDPLTSLAYSFYPQTPHSSSSQYIQTTSMYSFILSFHFCSGLPLLLGPMISTHFLLFILSIYPNHLHIFLYLILLFLKWPSSPTGTHDFHKLLTLHPLIISKPPLYIPLFYASIS